MHSKLSKFNKATAIYLLLNGPVLTVAVDLVLCYDPDSLLIHNTGQHFLNKSNESNSFFMFS